MIDQSLKTRLMQQFQGVTDMDLRAHIAAARQILRERQQARAAKKFLKANPPKIS